MQIMRSLVVNRTLKSFYSHPIGFKNWHIQSDFSPYLTVFLPKPIFDFLLSSTQLEFGTHFPVLGCSNCCSAAFLIVWILHHHAFTVSFALCCPTCPNKFRVSGSICSKTKFKSRKSDFDASVFQDVNEPRSGMPALHIPPAFLLGLVMR